jgi:hypothetical protein
MDQERRVYLLVVRKNLRLGSKVSLSHKEFE